MGLTAKPRDTERTCQSLKGHSLENECHAAFSNLETSDRGHELIRHVFTEVVNHASGPLFAASEVSPCWPLKRIQALPLTQCQTFVYSLFCMENIIYACEKLCVESCFLLIKSLWD